MANAGSFRKGEKRLNQGKRGPNKSTIEVREAIAVFAEANVSKMTDWLEAIDDPAKKMDLYLRAIEYHVPKLARTEGAGEHGEHLHKVFGWQT